MPREDTPGRGHRLPPPLRPVNPDSDPPPPYSTTLASDIRELKRRFTVRKVLGWITLATAICGGVAGVIAWVNSFAKAARVEKVEKAQLDTQLQVNAVINREAEHMTLHQQEAAEVHELHDDIREIGQLQRAALQQAIYTGRATHARMVAPPQPREEAHP